MPKKHQVSLLPAERQGQGGNDAAKTESTEFTCYMRNYYYVYLYNA